METQASFSVLLLSSKKNKKEEVRDSAAKDVQDEEIEESSFEQEIIEYNMEIEQIKRQKERKSNVEGTSKAEKKARADSFGSRPMPMKADLTILETKTQKPKVETDVDVRTSKENLPLSEMFLDSDSKVVTPKPEDLFEANSKPKVVDNNAVEIARSKSCKHGTSKTMICPECGINVHLCQMCKSAHKTFHRNQALTVCTVCGVDVIAKYLKRHMKKYHDVKVKVKRMCEFSGCEFKSLYRKILRSHFDRVHLNIPTPKDAICTECGKGFTDAYKLKSHVIADHLKLRPYKCNQCEKSFGRNKHLWSHQDVHKATDAYTCPVCGRGFRNNGAFFNHKKLHTRGKVKLAGSPRLLEVEKGSSKKGLRCGGCVEEVVVTSLEEMEEHMVALHPATGACWCDQCNYSFLDQETMLKHNKKYHASQGAKKRRYNGSNDTKIEEEEREPKLTERAKENT